MDQVADIRAKALKAREFTVTRGERGVTLRTPSRNEVQQVTHELGLRDLDNPVEVRLLEYALVQRFTVGWTGVRVCDLLPEPQDGEPADRTPVPCAPASVALYLDANPTECDALSAALLARVRTRNQALEVDEKNSSRTLPAPAAQTACAAPQPSSA